LASGGEILVHTVMQGSGSSLCLLEGFRVLSGSLCLQTEDGEKVWEIAREVLGISTGNGVHIAALSL
jgi:hypothetical protein